MIRKIEVALSVAVLRQLQTTAEQSAHRAYAPYSNFRVGAAVLAGGRVFGGANIENASYSATVCAERVALSAARIARDAPAEVIALHFLDLHSGAPLTSMLPCGTCRQWLAELAPECRVYVAQRDEMYSVTELLPEAFNLG